jgi:hypothetical protein
MQIELENTHPNLDIELFAINMIGTASGTSYFSPSLNLPMVQDSSSLGIWNDWGALWRDVFILNENNELVLVYNLTQYGLSDTNNYNTLMQHFIDVATP